jgi:UDP-N-acetylmuramyl pentapeptide phosphotransferase/UDP-N-acetylglucosamine-1-phosphate transferase
MILLSVSFKLLLTITLLLIISKKVKIFNDNSKIFVHKSFVHKTNNEQQKIIGGIFLGISIYFFFPNNLQLLKNYSLIFLFIGLMSDKNIIDHPLPRFILQFVFLISFILIADLKINKINLDFFDTLLSINTFNIFFTGLCLIILINGSNFLDGLNSLVAGYFLIVSICIYLLCNKLNSNFDIFGLQILIIALIIFLFCNILNFAILGDGGSYLLSFVVGVLLINFTSQNSEISPYFAALMLWYPAFENLFSLLRRKLVESKNPSKPDSKHLHQLIYLFISQKKIIRKSFCNSFSGLSILFFNVIIFLVSINFYNQSKVLILFIMLNIFAYLSLYSYLNKKLFTNNK